MNKYMYQKNTTRHTKGFSLIELVLYVAIVSLILFTLSSSLFFFLQSRSKTQTITMVTGDTARALELITKYIRQSEEVTYPAPGNGDDRIELIMVDLNISPTEIYLDNNRIVIEQNNSLPYYLTSDQVEITDLNFINNARVDTPDIIQITIQSKYNNQENRNEFDYNLSATTSASNFKYE